MTEALVVTAAVILLLFLIIIRTPIFIALGVSGLLGLFVVEGFSGIQQMPIAFVSQLENYSLVAAPMYILLGEILVVGGLGQAIFRAAHQWLARIPGGLALASVGSSTVFGAMSGVSISSVAVVGRMAVPEMLRRGYNPGLASGSVVASGALAMLIPPSLMFILFSSISGAGVGELFAAGLIPGLLLAVLMMSFVVLVATIRKDLAPRTTETITWSSRFASLVKIVPAMALIIVVLGSIYTGLATATEAAAIGAIGAALIVGLIDRALTWANIKKILIETTKISGSLLIIVGAAFAFTQLLVVVRAPEAITGAVSSLSLPPVLIAIVVLLIIAMLGCLVDAASLLLVVTPIVLPIFTTLGYDPIWVGVILVVTLETAVITPPVGLNLYTMKSVVPELDIADIVKGAIPYLFIEFALIVLLVCVPAIVTWFPSISAA